MNQLELVLQSSNKNQSLISVAILYQLYLLSYNKGCLTTKIFSPSQKKNLWKCTKYMLTL